MRTAHGDGELVKESHGRREGCGSVRKKKSSSWYELNNGNREEKKKEEESKCCGLWIMVSRCGGDQLRSAGRRGFLFGGVASDVFHEPSHRAESGGWVNQLGRRSCDSSMLMYERTRILCRYALAEGEESSMGAE